MTYIWRGVIVGRRTIAIEQHFYLYLYATLKSIDYNVAMTFILNNNNNNHHFY